MKKILSLLLALSLVMGLSVTAFADETYTLTINNTTPNHIYTAYQIFKGDLSNTDNSDTSEGTSVILSNIEWGDNVNGETLLGALATIEVADEAIFANCETAADVAKVLSGTAYNAALAQAFADVVGANLVGEGVNSQPNGTNYSISNLAAGYYIIKDTSTNLDEYDSRTAFILEVVENSTVTPKADVPTVEKTVNDNDANIGDTVTFTLTATMPSELQGYESYKLVFHDVMSKGLAFVDGGNVGPEDFIVTLNNGERIESGYTVNVVKGTEETTITVTFADVLGEPFYAKINDVIKVTYNATVDSDAVIGTEGNPNKVKLEYSNNPNGDGTGKTPEKEVKVYTWEIPVYKFKGSEENPEPLADAGFTLYTDEGHTNAVNLVATEGSTIYKVCTLAEEVCGHDHVNEIITGTSGKFEIEGLEKGTYYLVETNTPAGFNTAEPVTVVIGEDGAITANNTKVDEVQILNVSGNVLPETGGIGTTIFYALGAIMVIGAGVLLIAKKRMSNEG